MRVLVTYGRHSKTLAVVRSIGKSGRDVVVTDDLRCPISSFSRHCSRALLTASPKVSPHEFVADLTRAVEDFSVDLIIPMDDPECDALTKSGLPSKSNVSIALPPASAYATARDKNRTYRFAEELDIPVPRTSLVEGPDAIPGVIESLGFPFIVKPAMSSGSRGFAIISNREETEKVSELLESHGILLAQEFIPQGGSIGVSYLFNKGEMRSFFAHRRLIEYPRTGGPSIVRESIRHHEAERLGSVILQALDWHGIAMVEFRIDRRTQTPVLIEINPRFWGSLPLAIHSGVDFPRLLCDVYDKGDVAPVLDYPTGLKCVNLLPLGVASILGSRDLGMAYGILRQVNRKSRFDVESLEDPLPEIGAAMALLRYAFDSVKARDFFQKAK